MSKSIRSDSAKYSVYEIRSIIIFCLIMFGIAFSCIQVALINIRLFDTASGVTTSKTLVLGESRGMIYDADMNKLICNDYDFICAVKPSINVLPQIKNNVDDETYKLAVESVRAQMPFLIKTNVFVKSEDIMCEKIYRRYSDSQLAAHLIGYTDAMENKGISGVEYAYDSFLESHSGSLETRFFTNGKGAAMLGNETEKINKNYNSMGGLVLTIEKKCQTALENAMDENELKKGAAVVINLETGGISAVVSRPNFNPNNISNYLNDSDSPLFNRAFGEYPIGSVFKPLVAAAALEQGIDPEKEIFCSGNVVRGSSHFGCTKSHGKVNLATALIYSCNCYFVELIERLDCSRILDLAASLGFGNEIYLDDKISTYSGYMPEISELDSASSRAVFSFGQGKLSANPFQVAMIYSMIANKGECKTPYLIKGFCDKDGKFTSNLSEIPPKKLISEKNAELLKKILELAVREGTGKYAAVADFEVAGKTATAQSGEYIDGKERLVTWFAGFFPYEKPEYVAVIVCEDGESGSKDCAPVFSSLAKSIN